MSRAKVPKRELLARGRAALDQAYAPYSGARCAAAVWTGDDIFTGVNVENASYGLTCCAERVAIFRAITEGQRTIQALALVTSAAEVFLPCGACLQVLAEFARGDTPIWVAGGQGESTEYRLQELFPQPFRFSPGGG